MSDMLEAFGQECVDAIATMPGDDARDLIRQKLEALLRDPAFLARWCSDDAEAGVRVIWEDPETGLRVMQHIYVDGKTSPPHDHGDSWAVYGQAVEWTDMTVWKRLDDGSREGYAELEAENTYRLDPGMAGIFHPGEIHQIHFPDGARFIRVTGADLGSIDTSRFDPETNSVETSAGKPPSGSHAVTAGARLHKDPFHGT